MEDLYKKYKERLDSALNTKDEESVSSRNYEDFREEFLPKRLGLYEKWCSIAEKTLKVAPPKGQNEELLRAIETCHLKATPRGVNSFAYLVPLIIVVLGIVFAYFIPAAMGIEPNSFFLLLAVIIAAAAIIPLQKLPFILANSWRMKASNQMVLCTFYIVTYMRHTSNLELAVDFAAEHLAPPLSLDLKKVIWDIETQKYDSVKESLDAYLERWNTTNMEFVEAVHLIESSLYESAEARRLNALDKALQVMLEETYEKMLHYTHDLKNPVTTLLMMGIILPILGLVILPLATNFMGNVRWYHIFALYNIILPLIVFYYGKSILSNRPTGYGSADLSENPALAKKNRTQPLFAAILVFAIFFLIGILPLIIHAASPTYDCLYSPDPNGERTSWTCGTEFPDDVANNARFALLEYQPILDEEGVPTDQTNGPYGLIATILSFGIPLAFGLAIGIYYRMKTRDVMKLREESVKLEQEFASALFQLGNRLGDGIPAEIAFSKVAMTMKGTSSGEFFSLVSTNIRKLGMGMEDAIFDKRRGAILYYPSPLIESSMKVLVESSKKGPLVASQALINVSEYIKDMHRVDERLKDLMADITGSMKSQISFLAPAIAGIVVGITSMITKIMIVLSSKLSEMSAISGDSGQYGSILSMLGGGNAIPTYQFQLIVGLYVVEIVIALTILVNGIENGSDKLNEKHLIGRNCVQTTITYAIIALSVVLLFSLIAGNIITQISG